MHYGLNYTANLYYKLYIAAKNSKKMFQDIEQYA